MKTLQQIAQENPLYYADMAVEANSLNKTLAVDENDELILVETSKPILSYQESRSLKYPPFQEQLDMIYWDNVNGTDLWLQTISAIKSEFPKE